MYGVLDPVLGSQVQEGNGRTGASPAKGHKDGEETVAFLIKEEGGTVESGGEKAHVYIGTGE